MAKKNQLVEDATFTIEDERRNAMSENEQINRRLFPKVTVNEKGEGRCVIISRGSAAKFWRQRLIDAANDELPQVKQAMFEEVVRRQPMDEAMKTEVLSGHIVGPAAEITEPVWTDDAELLVFDDGSVMVMGLVNEDTDGLHVICTEAGYWVPATWLRAKLSRLRAEGSKLALRAEVPCGPDYACGLCDGCAGSCFVFVLQKRIDPEWSIVCEKCAEQLDPALCRAAEKIKLRTSPLWDLNSCQSPLWKDPELPRKLAAEGWRLLSAANCEIALKEPEAA
jgi:hypothetical protein